MQDTNNDIFRYSGGEALENMNEAVNYNAALLSHIERTGIYNNESKILDFGAGVGTFSKFMREKNLTIDCFEIDKDEAKYLRQEGFTTFENIDEVQDHSYDLIYSLNVLEHIEDHKKALQEIEKKLKVGGKLFLYVPAFQLLYSEFDTILGHFRRYKKSDLQAMLKESGFHIVDIEYYDTLGFLAAYIFKLVRAKPGQVTKKKIWLFDRIIFPCNRITDPIFRKFFGKNIYAVCIKK